MTEQTALKPKWKIEVKPISDNGVSEAKKNKGGMVVHLVSPNAYAERYEVARVAFERKNSAHPDTPFPDMLRQVVDSARAAVATLHEQLTWDGELQ